MISRATFVLLALGLAPAAWAQRPTGIVGEYTPPRTWPQQARRFDLLHQTMRIRFDAAHRQLFGEVTTRVALIFPTDTFRLDAENLIIDRATDPRGRALKFTQDTTHVTVRLPRTGRTGDTVEVTLTYHGFPERGLYFVPRRNVVWSQGEATETRAWIPTYDAANDKTTWDFYVTVDSGLVVLSNGRLVDVTPAPANAGQRVWHWSQERPASTYLYSVVAGPFTILKDQWRGIPVDYYTYPDTVDAAWRTFGETPAMIELYSELLGVPFPWAKYDQAIIPDFTYGGMENVSATTQTDLALHGAGSEPEQSGRGLDAHELAHQWFGDLTTTADWADAWLNEGLTTYMESVQNEKTRGWDAAALEWEGQQRAAMQADERGARPLVWGQYTGTDPIALFFTGHIYPKGAQLAHQLRRLLGDSLFWAGMHRFLVDNAYRPVTTADYAVAMEKTCQCDLDWFFDQWAYGIGYPRVHFTRHWDAASKTLQVTVTQTQPVDSLHPVFRFPVTLRIITRDSVLRQQIMVSRTSETFDAPLPSQPLSFRFDEGGWLLGTVTGDLSPDELAQMAEHDLDVRGRDWALDQLATSHDSTAQAARRLVVLNEHVAALRELALQAMGADSSAATRAVLRSAVRDPDGQVRGAALAALTAQDSASGLALAEAIYPSDPNNAARQSALGVIAQSRGAGALDLLLGAVGPSQPLSMRFTAVRYLGRLRDPRALDALEGLTASSEDRNLRAAGLNALLSTGDSARAASVALRLIGDPDPLFATAAVRVAARAGGASARASLEAALPRESRVFVRAAIDRALHPANSTR
ncbi:MAG TPA: M1 family aminopeptidase [Gemmatimonadales bacterium]|nr:M1 family aminopeptidase [Gemmatimonadales bacterium]